jgi:hypothetical protein
MTVRFALPPMTEPKTTEAPLAQTMNEITEEKPAEVKEVEKSIEEEVQKTSSIFRPANKLIEPMFSRHSRKNMLKSYNLKDKPPKNFELTPYKSESALNISSMEDSRREEVSINSFETTRVILNI